MGMSEATPYCSRVETSFWYAAPAVAPRKREGAKRPPTRPEPKQREVMTAFFFWGGGGWMGWGWVRSLVLCSLSGWWWVLLSKQFIRTYFERQEAQEEDGGVGLVGDEPIEGLVPEEEDLYISYVGSGGGWFCLDGG